MFATLMRATSLALSGIVTGIYVRDTISAAGVKRLPAAHYARYHQELDRDFAAIMPFVGGATLLANVATMLVPQTTTRRLLAAAALGCSLTEFGLTIARNVPLNAQVQSWSADAPPAEWATVRDQWLTEHRVRTGISLIGLGCLIAAALRR